MGTERSERYCGDGKGVGELGAREVRFQALKQCFAVFGWVFQGFWGSKGDSLEPTIEVRARRADCRDLSGESRRYAALTRRMTAIDTWN